MRIPILLASAALLVTACATAKSGADLVEVKSTGVPGEALATRTQTLSVTVTAVDAAKRTLTVQSKEGDTETFVVSPEVKRFGEIAPGDVLTVELAEGLLLEYQPAGTESVSVEPAAT